MKQLSRWVVAICFVAVAGLAGCGGDDDTSPTGDVNDGTFTNIWEHGGRTYAVTVRSFTWGEAKALAESYGVHLVTVNDEAENSFLAREFDSAFGNPWIGLNNLGGSWVWADGTKLGFTNWAPGEPSGAVEHCVMTNWTMDGAWNDGTCSDLRRAIVEW